MLVGSFIRSIELKIVEARQCYSHSKKCSFTNEHKQCILCFCFAKLIKWMVWESQRIVCDVYDILKNWCWPYLPMPDLQKRKTSMEKWNFRFFFWPQKMEFKWQRKQSLFEIWTLCSSSGQVFPLFIPFIGNHNFVFGSIKATIFFKRKHTFRCRFDYKLITTRPTKYQPVLWVFFIFFHFCRKFHWK